MDARAILSSASAAHAAGRLLEAASLCRQILAREPGNLQAALLLGVVSAKTGDLIEAVRLLEQVQGADPASFQAPFWLSVAYRKQRHFSSAIQSAEAAVRLNQNDPQGWAQLGICLLDARELAKSESSLRTAIRLAPAAIQIQATLCHCLYLQGRTQEARQALSSALKVANLPAEGLVKNGEALLAQEYAAVAAEFGRAAIRAAPDSAPGYLLAGRALMDGNGIEEAVTHLQSEVRLDPSNADSVAMLGMGLQGLGRIAEAAQLFYKSIELNPDQGYAYFALFQTRSVTEQDLPLISRMQDLLLIPDLPQRQRAYLHYGLGKACENLGRFEEAMTHYDGANRLEAESDLKNRPFQVEMFSARTDRMIQAFPKVSRSAGGPEASQSEIPIFVVGMMRSGTTLVEQVLSCHPEIGAAGELPFWSDNWRQAVEEPRMLAPRYLDLIGELAPGKARVVDKMPENRFGLGAIHRAFPRARIIHTRRNPVDTCLSIYSTPNRVHLEYAHNRESIVAAYKEYLRLMRHWRESLPPEIFLEIDYEDLVGDPEGIGRRMLDFCGLDWSERCLRPQDNPRSVATPSSWQVRQPIYKTSAQRWRSFEPWLGPFAELLG